MIAFLDVVAAELIKQQRLLFSNKRIYFSLLLWPLLALAGTYYMYKPFPLGEARSFDGLAMNSGRSLWLFVLTGQLGYTFIYGITESAWRLSWERVMGTLEAVLLSPVNRLAFVLGNSLAFMIQGLWMCTVVFSVMIMGLNASLLSTLGFGALGLLAMLLASACWGSLLNSIFLLSRDSGPLFMVFQSPVGLVAGVQVPSAALPMSLQMIGQFVPITYALTIMRAGLIGGSVSGVLTQFGALCLACAFTLGVCWGLLYLGERKARQTGSYNLF